LTPSEFREDVWCW